MPGTEVEYIRLSNISSLNYGFPAIHDLVVGLGTGSMGSQGLTKVCSSQLRREPSFIVDAILVVLLLDV